MNNQGKKNKKCLLIWEYLYSKRQFFGFVLTWIFLFFLVFFLSHESMSILWYPTILCLSLFGVYLCYDFYLFQKKHNHLKNVLNHIHVTTENLPEGENLIECDYKELLEQLFSSKNTELQNIRLSQNETMEYVTLWTHQIKTPLTALQLLANDIAEPDKTEFFTRLFEIEQYSDMLLQYLRLEGDSTDYVLKAYSLKAMANQSVKYFARIFISKGIAVKIDIPEEVTVVTDEKWIVFVLKQLISNALKYTKQGCITIDMPHKDCLRITDTGMGIAAEDLPRILEQGYTGYNGRKDKKATGLGLFLVARILRQLNHKIEITSKVNVGTKVTILFQ